MNESEIKIKIRKAIEIIKSLNSKVEDTDIIINELLDHNKNISTENITLSAEITGKKKELLKYSKRDKEIVNKIRSKMKNLNKILNNK